MSVSITMENLNRALASRINYEARNDPQSPYANKFVGTADGQVIDPELLPQRIMTLPMAQVFLMILTTYS
jgi:hypothetical protein